MKRTITLTLIFFLLLPNVVQAAYDPFCGCNTNPQIIGGSEEDNQKLKDYFDDPRSSSIADVENAAQLEQDWYKSAKEAILQNRKHVKEEYEKSIAYYPQEYHALLKQDINDYMKLMDASDYAIDKVHSEIAKGLYKYNSQIISQKIVLYVGDYGKNQGKPIKNIDLNENPVFIKINNVIQSFDQPPIVINGTTLVPMRAIFEKLGAKIEWDGATSSVKGTKGDRWVKLSIGSTEAIVNGKTISLDTSPVITNDFTMVPIRVVSEALGAKVEWEKDFRTVNINTTSS